MVLAVHAVDHVSGFSSLSHWGLECIRAGRFGVQLFFIVSAFTLFSSIQARRFTEPHLWRSFYLRRGFRILPLWWLAILLYALAGRVSFANALPSLFMYFWFWGNLLFPAQWSIFVEEFFYLCLPLVFRFIHSVRSAVLFLVLTAAFAAVWLHFGPRWMKGFTINEVACFPIAHFYCFAAGIFLARALAPEALLGRSLKRKGVRAVLFAITLISMGAMPFFNSAFATFAMTCLVAASFIRNGLIARITHTRFLGRFGVACYSIYLFHFLILQGLEPVLGTLMKSEGISLLSTPLRFTVWFLVFSLVNLLVGTLSFRYLERPCVRFGKRIILSLSTPRLVPTV